MPQGNWTCSKCGGSITELPFEPKSEEGLKCKACFAKERNNNEQSSGSESDAAPQGERKMYSGDWKCAGCGAAITELPFEPRNTENLKCIDCFKKSRA